MSSQETMIQVPPTAGAKSPLILTAWCDSELTELTVGLMKS
jgi:hypothetical protein